MSHDPLTHHTGFVRHLGDDIGYLQLRNLHYSTTTSTVRMLLKSIGSVRGLIIDLRDTVGDNFYVAVNTLPLFMSSGVLWSHTKTTGRGILSSTITLTPDHLEWEGQYPRAATRRSTWVRYDKINPAAPILLLINGTDSLSVQVIAQALKQNGAAILWGSPTCGRAPATFVGANNGNFQRLVHSQEFLKNGDKVPVPIDVVPPCMPDKEVVTDCWDDALTTQAKQELRRIVSRLVPVIQPRSQANAC